LLETEKKSDFNIVCAKGGKHFKKYRTSVVQNIVEELNVMERVITHKMQNLPVKRTFDYLNKGGGMM
jgi:hypothetical protein